MQHSYRQLFFTIFAVFYIVTLPFLVIFSLGYNINLNQQELTNSLVLKIETFPRGATIASKGGNLETPVELRIPENDLVNLQINHPDYLSEEFTFWSKPGENAAVRLSNLWLLPTERMVYDTENYTNLSILSESLILLKKENQYFLQGYSYAGLQGKKIEIQNPSNLTIKKGVWEVLLEDMFWQREQNLLLFPTDNNKWQAMDLASLPIGMVNLVKVSSTQVLALSKDGGLWLLNLATKQTTFLDNGFWGISFTNSPNSIWLGKDDSIYRLERNAISPETFNLNNNLYTSSFLFLPKKNSETSLNFHTFSAKSVFLGMAFKVGNQVAYVPDSNKEVVNLIETDVEYLGASGSTIFWLNENSDLFAYNFLLKSRRLVTSLKLKQSPEGYKIDYNGKWGRILIYSPKEVNSVWFDTDFVNQSILTYYPKTWIADAQCLSKMADNYQFCISEEGFVSLKNNTIAF